MGTMTAVAVGELGTGDPASECGPAESELRKLGSATIFKAIALAVTRIDEISSEVSVKTFMAEIAREKGRRR